MKRKLIKAIVVFITILIVLYFIPVKSAEEIKYERPEHDGGPVVKVTYNIYGIKLY